MHPALWQRVESVCFEAMTRRGAERDAFVAAACDGDEELRREVEAQLVAMETDPDFLETPIARVSDLRGPDADGFVNRHLGPYRITRPLARGGMGEVYLATYETEDFRRTVAIKLIRQGFDSEDVVRRFRLERQILASLHHPNIAQLHGGGAAEDGSPYFVMEYVEGLPIDRYCEDHHLGIRERLALFLEVCAAVQHAHQNLVIHRDLKPSNILVTKEGVPKLLDFGIGKVLERADASTREAGTPTRLRALTPEYASPEQIRGEPVTTASDVYSLGVLLFLLLAGRRPFVEQSPDDLERAVREHAPPRPSDVAPAFARQLAGDLDHIVLKALRKEPDWRYPLVTSLAEDIQRHLDGLPVKARADTLMYRSGKFLRRNRWPVTAAAILFAALASTTVLTMRQSRRVAQERDRALEVRSFLMEAFGATSPDRATGSAVTARQLLDAQIGRLDSVYGSRPELHAMMLEVLADGYDRLGLYDQAEPIARASLTLRRATLGSAHPDVATSLNLLGWILHERGSAEEAERLLGEAVAIRRGAGRRYLVELSRSLNDLGVVVDRRGASEEAEALYREALRIRIDRLGEGHRAVGITANNLAAALYRQRRYDEAVPFAEQALRSMRATVGPDHQRAIIAQSNLAAMKLAAGELQSAEQEFRDLLERQRRLQGPTHPVTAHQMNALAMVLNQADRFEEAESAAREALAIRRDALGESHPDVAASLTTVGDALLGQRRHDEALTLYRQALDIRRRAQPDRAAMLRQLEVKIDSATARAAGVLREALP